MRSPIDLLLQGDAVIPAAALLVAITLARKQWYEGTKANYESQGISLDNEQKLRNALQESDSALLATAEREMNEQADDGVLSQIERANPGLGLSRREFFQALVAGTELPIDNTVETQDPGEST